MRLGFSVGLRRKYVRVYEAYTDGVTLRLQTTPCWPLLAAHSLSMVQHGDSYSIIPFK